MFAGGKDIDMLNSNCKDTSELPIFLNVPTVAKLLGISVSSCYELARNKSFPKLRIGSHRKPATGQAAENTGSNGMTVLGPPTASASVGPKPKI